MSAQSAAIGDFVDVVSGPAFKSDQFTDDSSDIPLIKGENIAQGYIAWNKSKYWPVADAEAYERFGLGAGDIVLAMDRPWVTAGLKWARLTSHDPSCLLVQRVARLRAKPGLRQDFLAYVIGSTAFSDYVRNIMGGTNVPHISGGQIKAFTFRMPSEREQAGIACVLSAYDNLIENNRKRIALLEETARLLYREWFVHLRFPGHEHAKVIDGVPTGWHRRLLCDLCPPKSGIQTGPFGSQLHQSDYTDEGVPVVMPKEMQSYRIETDGIARIPEEVADRLGRHRMEVGDTVYGRRGDIGRRAFIGARQRGWLCGTGSLRIRPDATQIVPRYLFETLGAPQTAGFIANQAKGSTMPNLSAGALLRVPILCPPMSLQRTFVEAVEPLNEQVEVLLEQNQKLKAARDLLLPRLMNGEIVV